MGSDPGVNHLAAGAGGRSEMDDSNGGSREEVDISGRNNWNGQSQTRDAHLLAAGQGQLRGRKGKVRGSGLAAL